ncbi:phosphotransferase [Paenibacillus sp.]|uniref:phosphotransferase enzyme family protein n=1 Tax=Paenibacillus sp. TaxID=58172 RepID=UPI002816A65B|nr:phosphotransferase [Paenibacillus sp.]MDR0269947.1 phosphotransferase [Paenibacillus sp.]
MKNEDIYDVLSSYDLLQPVLTFLRHNENRTYRVDDASGGTYLLRIHQPVKDGMVGLQHTYDGLLGELKMLEHLAAWSGVSAQKPVCNHDGELITVFVDNGVQLNCSLLTWLEGRDLNKEDLSDHEVVRKLGHQLGELHSFFRKYPGNDMEKRPSQGVSHNNQMVKSIHKGLERGLFTSEDVSIIEQTIELINSRLEEKGKTDDTWGLIHGDLGMGNVIMSPEGEMSFIDFGFFGTGYYLLDVAMGTQMIPANHRDIFLESYYGDSGMNTDDRMLIEGFMLVAIIGYYAFQIDNESVHAWMRERMPRLCTNYCIPFLAGESIFYIA